MLFKNITILDENFDIKNDMYVGILNDRIDYIGKDEPKTDYGRIYDGKGKLLMSAFFNAHAHSAMTLMRGYGENMNLQDWLTKKIFPFEDHLDSKAVYNGTLLSMAESLKFGICSNSDMYFFMDDMAAAIKTSKMKANLARSVSQFDDSNPWESERLKEMKRTFEAYHNTENGRLKMDISLHSEYTTKPWTCDALSEYAKKVNARIQVHISETKDEHEDCIKRYGLTPTAYMLEHGVWDVPAIAAHCVWCDDNDLEILKDKGVTVAVNPVSNLKLASGICNVQKLLDKGINVGIGTDSVSSNNSLDFFEEMKMFALLTKVATKDPTAVTPKQALYSATRGGALAQGREDSGFVKVGFKADLMVLDIDQPNMKPVYNMLNNLVYSATSGDIKMTMVDGNVLYENGEYMTIDIDKVIYEVDDSINRIMKEL